MKTGFILGLLAALALAPAASAGEPVSFAATAAGSSTYNTVLAIAKAASVHAGLDLRPRSFKSTTQGLGFVDSGEVSLGLESALGLSQAYLGKGLFEGKALPRLRLVATIYPFRAGIAVRDSDPARAVADIKGKRIASGFRSAPSIDALERAILASAGLSYSDMVTTDVSILTDAQDGFLAGASDAVLGSTNSANIAQMETAVGKLRFLAVGSDQAAIRAIIPNGRVVTIDPGPGIVGLQASTPMLEYDYFVYASVDTSDDVVVGVIDSLLKGQKELIEMSSGFTWFDPGKIGAQIGVPYHPAAEAHLKELGLWQAP